MSLVLRFAAGSHKGMIREGNEDSGYAGPRLLAVADGMGGAAAGEVASSEVLSTMVVLDEDVPGTDVLTALGQTVDRANDRLRELIEEDPQLEGMGTTLTALLWTGQRLGMVHIGDSRAYLLRDGVLNQITQDHTWVQRLVDEGRITEEEATTHPQRSLLMRALGTAERVEPDLSIREVRAGDRYLLCSDGLSGVVSQQTLEETLGSYYSPQQTVQELIQLALRGGGPDNITCVVADVLDVGGTDTLSGQLNDTPVVVGAVAEGPAGGPWGGHHTLPNTPAARAAGLGRAGATDPNGQAETGYDGRGGNGYDGLDDDEPYGRRRRRGLKAGLITLLALVVLVGGGWAGYRWTQSQYYVGTNGDHVAVYRGVDQSLAGIDLSSVYQDYPGIQLKYLPSFQKTQVDDTISVSGLSDAQSKVASLQDQAAVCKTVSSTGGQTASGTSSESATATPSAGATSSATAKPGGTATQKAGSSPKATATASASPSLTPQQRQLAGQCSSTSGTP
jgi:protein phosphatase